MVIYCFVCEQPFIKRKNYNNRCECNVNVQVSYKSLLIN